MLMGGIMKKIGFVSILSFFFLFISSLIAYILGGISFSNVWFPLTIGVCILILSGGLAFFAKNNTILNAICYLTNGVALGFFIRAWYIYRGFNNPIWLFVLVSLSCVVYLWIVFALSKIPCCYKHPKLFILVVLLLSLVGYILLIVLTKTTYVSTFGYYMIIEIAFLFAMFNSSDNFYELFRKVTLSTYSVFVVAVIIIISIVSGEGDFDLDIALEEVEIYPVHSDEKRKRQKL